MQWHLYLSNLNRNSVAAKCHCIAGFEFVIAQYIHKCMVHFYFTNEHFVFFFFLVFSFSIFRTRQLFISTFLFWRCSLFRMVSLLSDELQGIKEANFSNRSTISCCNTLRIASGHGFHYTTMYSYNWFLWGHQHKRPWNDLGYVSYLVEGCNQFVAD